MEEMGLGYERLFLGRKESDNHRPLRIQGRVVKSVATENASKCLWVIFGLTHKSGAILRSECCKKYEGI